MHIVARIKLPKSHDVSSLYVQCNEAVSINFNDYSQEIVLRKGGQISLNSYFNSFYEKFYAKYTNINSVYYLLKLEGDFQVAVYREVYEQNNRELICVENFSNCHLANFVKLQLPSLVPSENTGRIYLEIICCSELGLFKESLLVTDQEKLREVSLGIISCTFKKEAYIKTTVNTILQDNLLEKKEWKIFVVDNGRTLSEDAFNEPRVQLIPNRNMGGSGGFTRGLIEALDETIYSHFLFMDDDIELDSECIYRLFSLYEYANSDFAVAGSMLDLYKKHVLYEAGALHGKTPENPDFAPFAVTPLKHNLDLENANSLNLLMLEDNVDYGGFWFFSFSKEIVKEIGVLLPLFIKVDDMEFGLRITRNLEKKIIAFPSIAVWHEPFYAKFPYWDNYYHFRNNLITHTIYDSLTYVDAIKIITELLLLCLLVFDYKTAEMMVKAFEDYMKGPEFIKNSKPEILHSDIVKLSTSYASQKIQQNYVLSSNQLAQNSRPGMLNKMASLLTLNGHLLPNFLITEDEALILHLSGSTGQRSKAFAKKRAFVFEEKSASLFQNEINKGAGIKIFVKWLQLAATSTIKWSFISTAWKNAASEMTSAKFWQKYIGLEK